MSITSASERMNVLQKEGVKFQVFNPRDLAIPMITVSYDKCVILYYDREKFDFIIELFSHNGRYSKCSMQEIIDIKSKNLEI